MMDCKDCVHFDVCKDATVPNPEYKGPHPDKSKECRHFKNKADFVEVVRCEECRSARKCFACYKCRVTGERHNGGHYCSYGKRKETE